MILGRIEYNASGDALAPTKTQLAHAGTAEVATHSDVTLDAGYYHAAALTARTPEELASKLRNFYDYAVGKHHVRVLIPGEVRPTRTTTFGQSLVPVSKSYRATVVYAA